MFRVGKNNFKISTLFWVINLCTLLFIIEITFRFTLPFSTPTWLSLTKNKEIFFTLKNTEHPFPETHFPIKPRSWTLIERKKKIAFIGDSVTYCVGIAPLDCFTEKLQRLQKTYDVFNFGVPGYGVLENTIISKELINSNLFDDVVYVFNVNDIYDAMPYLLSLQRNPKSRFASFYTYEGTWQGDVKLFLLNYYKSPLILKYYLSLILGNLFTPLPTIDTMHSSPTSAQGISMPKHSETYSYSILGNMYLDPSLRSRLSSKLQSLLESTKNSKSKLTIVPFFDEFLLTENGKRLRTQFLDALEGSNLNVLNLYDSFKNKSEYINIYLSDRSHFNENGTTFFSHTLLSTLLKSEKTQLEKRQL